MKNKSRFTLIELMVSCFIIISLVITIVVIGGAIVGGCYVKRNGLKSSAERVWEGPESDSEIQKEILTEEQKEMKNEK